MAQIVFDRNVAFGGLPDSQGYAQVAATGSTVLDIQKNGANIGTITFATRATPRALRSPRGQLRGG